MCPSVGTLETSTLAGELVNVAHAHLMWYSNSTCTAFFEGGELTKVFGFAIWRKDLDVHSLDCQRVASAAL